MANPNYQLIRYQADNIPNFDGNTRTLSRFITSCEHFLQNHQNRQNPADQLNVCLFDTVIGKLTGRAADLIASRTELDTWQKIKDSLIITFSDQRSEDCLVQDIITMKLDKNESPQTFGLKLQDARSLLFSKINNSNDAANVKLLKIQQFDDLCLKTFINNLNYHMQLVVRLKDPDSLEQALAFVREEENFIQFKNKSNSNTKNMPTGNNNKNKNPFNNAYGFGHYSGNVPRMPHYSGNVPGTTFNNNLFRPNNFQNFARPNYFNSSNFVRNPNMPFNNQYTRPQWFNPNTNFNRSVQRTNTNNNPNRSAPEPMDTSSGNTRINTIQRPRQNNPVAQELFNQSVNTLTENNTEIDSTQETNIDETNNDYQYKNDFSNYQPTDFEGFDNYANPFNYMYNVYDNANIQNTDFQNEDFQYQNFPLTPNLDSVT